MRKSKILAAAFILICFTMVVGCNNIPIPNPDRTSLSVEKALIGHWVSQGSEATNYYISRNDLIKVQQNGTTEKMVYKILETNDKTNEIKIHVTTSNAGGIVSDNRIKFATDKKSMTETTEVLNIVTNTETFSYVDNKIAP